MAEYRPQTEDEACAIVREAIARARPLQIIGHGTKSAMERVRGPAKSGTDTLNMTGLSGILSYAPEELVLTARAGTPMADINAALQAKGQELAFEPMDYGPLFGLKAGRGTIGGVLATNTSGPRRIKAGAARDHFLGVRAVSGRGEIFQAGGQVVKNVTGYDMCKGLAGSWGTLAVMTEVSLKTVPRAETQASLLLFGQDVAAATEALCAALGTNADVCAGAYLPQNTAAHCLHGAKRAITGFRLSGFAPSVEARTNTLRQMFTDHADIRVLDARASADFWRYVRDVAPFQAGNKPLWRVSVPPSEAPVLIEAIRARCNMRFMLDWGGGLVWIEITQPSPDAGAAAVRGEIAKVSSGHANLVRCPAPLDGSVPIVQPLAPALAQLSERLRLGFDPAGVLNPGRLSAVV